MPILEKIKRASVYCGLKKDEYQSLQKDMMRLNQVALKGITAITAAYMVVMLATSCGSAIAHANRIHFIWCLCLCAGILGVTMMGLLKTRTATLIAVYAYLATMFSYGIAIGSTQTSQTAVSFLIFIMVGPLLFYDVPLRMNLFVWVFNILFIVISMKTKTPAARFTDVLNGLSYAVISSFMNVGSMVLKVSRVWLQRQLEVMADIDALTKLKNRNCFERSYQSYAKQAKKRVSCVYIDANGLHEINNCAGHEAGDRMLKTLADQILQQFGREDAYRVGGDEFLIFCCDGNDEELYTKLEALSQAMRDRQYSVSIGTVSMAVENLNMDDLILMADAEMYAQKEEYYEQMGNNRRKQREEVRA